MTTLKFPLDIDCGVAIVQVINKRYIALNGSKVITKVEDGYYVFKRTFDGKATYACNVTDAVLYLSDKPKGFQDKAFKALSINWSCSFRPKDAEAMYLEWTSFQESQDKLAALIEKWLKESVKIETPQFKYVGYTKKHFDVTVRSSTYSDFICKAIYVNRDLGICVTEMVERPEGEEITSPPFPKAFEFQDITRMLYLPKTEPMFLMFTFNRTTYYL